MVMAGRLFIMATSNKGNGESKVCFTHMTSDIHLRDRL